MRWGWLIRVGIVYLQETCMCMCVCVCVCVCVHACPWLNLEGHCVIPCITPSELFHVLWGQSVVWKKLFIHFQVFEELIHMWDNSFYRCSGVKGNGGKLHSISLDASLLPIFPFLSAFCPFPLLFPLCSGPFSSGSGFSIPLLNLMLKCVPQYPKAGRGPRGYV